MKTPASHPILSCDEARTIEQSLFAGDEAREWPAMQRAGRAIAAAALRDFQELGGFPAAGRILVLAGKGHNAGDALIAAHAILEKFPAARAEVVFAFGSRALRPLAARAWRDLVHFARDRVSAVSVARGEFALCLDGIFGFQFRPPADERITALIASVNALSIHLRAAVDLPSAELFRADFTYATGCVKTPLLDSRQAGRVRYLDLGFFEGERADPQALSRVLLPSVLAPLAALRPPHSDKRTFGHVFLVGGSRAYPGAILMSTLAALRSGAGLVTACVPESLVPGFAAHTPEAMWIGWPETPSGSLALEGEHLLRARLDRATALVLGPGLGREPETLALARSIVATSSVPLVIDADALQPDIVDAGTASRVLTPHAGEWKRIGNANLSDTTVVLKGPVTRIESRAGLRPAPEGRSKTCPTYHSFFGGPVLARGGSGDLLAGLMGGLLAQAPAEPLLAAARGVVWHGLAADHLARAHGQTSVSVTQLLDFLSPALNESAHAP
ncbi:MAG: NAD(P)H-hydrate dehydratase [Opitutaceae bacterium]|nr:NAD(P)H-hydrate dehydratase [Opitutaceae bacterium]